MAKKKTITTAKRRRQVTRVGDAKIALPGESDQQSLAAAGVVGEHPAFVIVCVSEKGAVKTQWAAFERKSFKAQTPGAAGQVYERLTAPRPTAAAVCILLTEILTNKGV